MSPTLVSENKTGITSKPEKRVFFFLDSIPQKQGSGASLRFYSNVRAYLDLGYEVEAIQVSTQQPADIVPNGDLQKAQWIRVVESCSSSSLAARLMFRAGVLTHSAVSYYIERHPLVYREIQKRIRQDPHALFHLEGELMASVLPWIPNTIRTVWSLHDLPSTVSAATTRIACEAQSRSPTPAEIRELRFARRFERSLANHASLVLCIADYDRERLRDWGCRAVEYFPLSIPDEPEDRTREWAPNGHLRLLHLGSISHLPSYRSLEFLFERVWPKLPAEVLDRISLDVVGTVNSENERAQKILNLANRFTNVAFHGHVPDVAPYYRNADLQIVASTDATGLRTRTIESFAYGLPVLSTAIGARGIAGVKAGEHFLMANDAEEFVKQLAGILNSPESLHNLSMRAKDFYRQNQSRSVVASTLAEFLNKYFGM